MKNIVFLMIFIYMISACESISKIDVAFDESCFHKNNIRSYDEAYSINVMHALEYFDYQSDGYSVESILDILSSLNNGRPVYMQGVDDCNTDTYSDDVGHAWVIDGYVEYVTTIDSYENGQLIGSFPYDDYHVMHINWGWNGVCNGYFYFGEYDTSEADSYDGVHYGAYDFDSENKMYANIRK